MFLMRIASIAFLLGCLLPHTDPEKQLLVGPQAGRSKKSRGNYTVQLKFLLDYDCSGRLYAEIWDLRCDGFDPSEFWPQNPSTTYFDCPSLCLRVANLESGGLGVVNSVLSWVWAVLLGFVVNTNTLILLSLPAYHRGRALHIIHGLSDGDDSQSQMEAWEQLIRPLMEEWKTVCGLATLTSGAALAIFHIPGFNNNIIISALAYATLVFTTTAILLSSIMMIHLGGEKRDPVFIQAWLENFRSTDHRSLWGAWVIVSLPSVWTVWGSLSFIFVALLVWSGSGATAIGTADTAAGSSLTASNSAVALEPSTDIPSLLTAIALFGFFNISGVVFSFWKQGRRQSTILEAA